MNQERGIAGGIISIIDRFLGITDKLILSQEEKIQKKYFKFKREYDVERKKPTVDPAIKKPHGYYRVDRIVDNKRDELITFLETYDVPSNK